MNSPTLTKLTKLTKMTTTTNDLPTQLLQLGLPATAHALDDFLARATKSRSVSYTHLTLPTILLV